MRARFSHKALRRRQGKAQMMRLQQDDSNAFSLFAEIRLNTLLRRAIAESYKHLELLPHLNLMATERI